MRIKNSLKFALFAMLGATTVSAANFKLQKPVYSVAENAGPVTVTVLRSGVGTNAAASVELFTTNLTAQAGLDYVETVTTVNFDPGQLSATATVDIVDDATIEPTQTFRVRLRNPSTGNVIAAPSLATVLILDDDAIIQFSSKKYLAQEALKFATVTVRRFGSLTATARVDFATSDGSATSGSDYTPTNGTLIFPPHVAVRTFQVRPVNDTIDETNETVNLTLSNVVGATLGTNDTAILTILDNDSGGIIKLAPAVVHVDSSKTNVVLTIMRTGGLASDVTVHFTTADVTAIDGTNYTATAGTVTFPAGVIKAAVNVPITPIAGTGENKTFTFTISDATGGAKLGVVTQAVVTIVFQQDPNVVPLAGPVFMSGTIGGQPFSALTASVQGVNGSIGFNLVGVQTALSGYYPTVKQLQILVQPFQTGTIQIDNTGTHGLLTYLVSSSGRAWAVADGSSAAGSYGTFIFDGIDTVNKRASGRFSFHARETTGNVAGGFIEIVGKFRVVYHE